MKQFKRENIWPDLYKTLQLPKNINSRHEKTKTTEIQVPDLGQVHTCEFCHGIKHVC